MSFALTVALIIFILIFILRMPISIGMLVSGAFYFLIKGTSLQSVCNFVMNTYYTNYVIIAVPLFIFTANVMNSGKVTEKVFRFANALSGGRRGALGHVNVIASLVFSGMTGSAIADASGLGKMEIDAMKKEGYDDGFSCAITAASATIGPIFPPSIPLVMYAMFAGSSVGALFLGGMIPALLVAAALMLYVSLMSHLRNYPRAAKIPFQQFFHETLGAIPALLTPVILLAGIYTGVMTPTEAGAIAGLYAIVISFFCYRALSWKGLWEIIKDTVAGTGSVSLMIGAASVISYIVAREQIANNLGDFIIGLHLGKIGFLILTNVVILILGMFMDTSTIQLVFVPILIPVAAALGIDLLHFGLVVTLNMMIGLSTPPFGMLLFITANISDTPLKKVMTEILIPLIFLLAVLAFITFVPQSVLFLPKLIGMAG